MTDREKYICGCNFAIRKLVERGSSAYAIIDDGKWITVPWKDILEWLDKEYKSCVMESEDNNERNN